MAKKLMQKVRNSKTLPKDRKLIELRGLNETLTNLQIERVELLNEFDEGDKKPSAKVGLSSEMSKKIANEKKILKKTIEIKQARITTRTCRLGIRGEVSRLLSHIQNAIHPRTEDSPKTFRSRTFYADNASTPTHEGTQCHPRKSNCPSQILSRV